MKPINHLREISHFYNAFVIDLWGVLHDGETIFPNALEVLKNLKNINKKVYLITNNPETDQENVAKLKRMGIAPDLYSQLICSGEKCKELLKSNSIFSEKQRPLHAFVVEETTFCLWLESTGIRREKNPEKADFILGFSLHEAMTPLSYDSFFLPFLNRDTLFVCVNPDEYVIKGGERKKRIGWLARCYEQMGGRVLNTGKPNPLIYEDVLKEFPPHKILMIGDSLNTDIKGAHTVGSDSLLIATGNHWQDLLEIPQSQWDSFFKQKENTPTFTSFSLCW